MYSWFFIFIPEECKFIFLKSKIILLFLFCFVFMTLQLRAPYQTKLCFVDWSLFYTCSLKREMEDVYYLWKSAGAKSYLGLDLFFYFWNVMPLMYLCFYVTKQNKMVELWSRGKTLYDFDFFFHTNKNIWKVWKKDRKSVV